MAQAAETDPYGVVDDEEQPGGGDQGEGEVVPRLGVVRGEDADRVAEQEQQGGGEERYLGALLPEGESG